MSSAKRWQIAGVQAALTSAFFLGFAPIFGKRAIVYGMPPLAVVALRTILAAVLLLVLVAIFRRRYLYIYPAGLLGCALAGGINGLGSLFYYSALARLDAGVGQLLYLLYPLFVAFWLFLDHQPPSRMTLVRLVITIPAVALLTQASHQPVDSLGIVFMLIASALYALHLPINQRVLYDMPAPTVTLYTLLAMSLTVGIAFLISGRFGGFQLSYAPQALWAIFALTVVTFFSRLTLFLGVKHIGGMQTALLGLSELLITVGVAQFWLGERLSLMQWGGVTLLVLSLVLMGCEQQKPLKPTASGWLHWLRPPGPPNIPPWQPHD